MDSNTLQYTYAPEQLDDDHPLDTRDGDSHTLEGPWVTVHHAPVRRRRRGSHEPTHHPHDFTD